MLFSNYSFNSQEHDDEIAGDGNSMTAMFWQYDARLGRRWNIDPVDHVSVSSYATFANSPIYYSDPNGDDWNIDKTTDKDGNTTYNITVKAAIINTSGYALDLKKFESQIKEQLTNSYTGEFDADKWGNKVSFNIKVDLRTVTDESELKEDDHVIEVLKSNDPILKDGNSYAKAKGEIGGSRIYVGYTTAIETASGANKRTIAHEFGHTLGLPHPDEERTYDPTYLFPRADNGWNVMFQTRLAKEWFGKDYNQSNKFSKPQVALMYENFKGGDVNKNNNFKYTYSVKFGMYRSQPFLNVVRSRELSYPK